MKGENDDVINIKVKRNCEIQINKKKSKQKPRKHVC